MSNTQVTVNFQKREVVLTLDGVDIALTFNRVRALCANGLEDAIAHVRELDSRYDVGAELELHRAAHADVQAAGFHDSNELLDAYQRLVARTEGTPPERLNELLAALMDMFPGVVNDLDSAQPEVKFLEAIKNLQQKHAALAKAARELTASIVVDLPQMLSKIDSDAWNAVTEKLGDAV